MDAELGPPAALRDQVKAEVRAKCVGAEGMLTAKAMIIVATDFVTRLSPKKVPKPKTIEGWVTEVRKTGAGCHRASWK